MQSSQDEIPLSERKVVRRGLIAGLAAFGAAAALKVTGKTPNAEGAHNGNMLIGGTNVDDSGFTTGITADKPNGPVFVGFNGPINGSFSNPGQRVAVQGITTTKAGFSSGVHGYNDAGGLGVLAESNSATATGVYGSTAPVNGTTFPTTCLLYTSDAADE